MLTGFTNPSPRPVRLKPAKRVQKHLCAVGMVRTVTRLRREIVCYADEVLPPHRRILYCLSCIYRDSQSSCSSTMTAGIVSLGRMAISSPDCTHSRFLCQSCKSSACCSWRLKGTEQQHIRPDCGWQHFRVFFKNSSFSNCIAPMLFSLKIHNEFY